MWSASSLGPFVRDLWRSFEPGMEVSEDTMELDREKRILGDEEDGEDGEDKELALELLMYSDRQAAVAFRERIIPFAVQWYIGEAAPVDSDVGEEGGRT